MHDPGSWISGPFLGFLEHAVRTGVQLCLRLLQLCVELCPRLRVDCRSLGGHPCVAHPYLFLSCKIL